MTTPKGRLMFEPHNGYGGKTPDGDLWPFGYLSTIEPRVPVFELNVVMNWDRKVLLAYAQMAAASPDLLDALVQLHAFVGTMHGQGADAVIPETVRTQLGLPVKIGEIMRAATAAIARAEGK